MPRRSLFALASLTGLGVVVLALVALPARTGGATSQATYRITLGAYLRGDRPSTAAAGVTTEVGQAVLLIARRSGGRLAPGETFAIARRPRGQGLFRVFHRCGAGRTCRAEHVATQPGDWEYRAFVFTGSSRQGVTRDRVRGRSNVARGVFRTPMVPQVILTVNGTTAVNETLGEAGGQGQPVFVAPQSTLDLTVTTNLGVLPNGWWLYACHSHDVDTGNPNLPLCPPGVNWYLWCDIRGGDPRTGCAAQRATTLQAGQSGDFVQATLYDGTNVRASALIILRAT